LSAPKKDLDRLDDQVRHWSFSRFTQIKGNLVIAAVGLFKCDPMPRQIPRDLVTLSVPSHDFDGEQRFMSKIGNFAAKCLPFLTRNFFRSHSGSSSHEVPRAAI